MNKRMAAGLILLALLLTLCGCNRAQETSITVMSQNLRVDSSSDGEDNDVLYRSDRLIWLLEQYRPDVVGMQEYTSNWDFMLTDFLEESDYQIVFEYRAHGDQEATPILYNAKKLELESTEFFWLSETPEQESPSWDDGEGRRCRIATECVFKEKSTGIRFVHINTHFGLTTLSQSGGGALIHQRVKEKYADMPVFVTGDFNCQEGSEGYRNITEDGLLTDSFLLAEEFGNICGTFNGFKDDGGSAVIDFIFVTEKVSPGYYSVLNEKPEGKFVSDHFAVLTRNTVSR